MRYPRPRPTLEEGTHGEGRTEKGAEMTPDKKVSKGDKVSWSSHGEDVGGTVEKKITKRTEASGRTVDASSEEPQYEVRSDRSGRTAVHKPSALRKKGKS